MPEELKLNPLYTIFEKHLYDFDEHSESENEFVDKIVNDYIKFLVSKNVAVPLKWKAQIAEELRDQVRQMIVKKMYGCLTIQEFILNQKKNNKELAEKRKRTKKQYRGLY